MIRTKRGFFIVAVFTATVINIILFAVYGSSNAVSASQEDTVDIVFSTDIHSYLSSYTTVKDGETVNIGGTARMSTYINEMRKEHPDLVLLDAGDYPMGTLYQTLYTQEAFEYRMLSFLGYDAITFGNHDFDYGTEGMALQFEAAKSKCDYYPNFLICNVDWNAGDDATNRILESMDGMNLKDYVIIERGGLKIGITGVLGKDALACAPTCELTVSDPIESVKKTVAEMKDKDDPDIIICISHSGIAPEGSKMESEDENLAKKVHDLDFIVSGHTHIALPECIKVGDTYIGSSGCYSEYMGYAQLKRNAKGRYDLVSYELTPMDEDVPEDPEVLSILEGFDNKINEEFLSQYGYTADQVIGHNSYDFSSVDDLYNIHDDHNLGQLIADAYRWKVNNTDTGNDDTVAGAAAPSGTIRATFPKGDITVGKVYEVFSLGMGLDGTIGYPLVEVYLTGEELLTLCEVDASVSDYMNSDILYMSGLEFEFNPNRALLNKTESAGLEKEIGDDTLDEIDRNRMYRVVTDLYTYRMLGAVKDISKGLISIVPKLKDGSPINDESKCVLHDENGDEIKAWIAIADYIQSFDDDGDGIGEIPALYDGTDDRKQIDDSKNIIDIIKNPNRFFWEAVIIVIVLTAVIVLLIVLAAGLIKRAKNKGISNNKTEKKE